MFAAIQPYLKTNTQGTTLFYPCGIFGNAYLVPNADKEKELNSIFARNFDVIMLLLLLVNPIMTVLVSLVIGEYVSFTYLTIIYYTWSQIELSSLTKGLTVVKEKLTLEELCTLNGKRSKLFIWFFSIVLFIMLVLIVPHFLSSNMFDSGVMVITLVWNIAFCIYALIRNQT